MISIKEVDKIISENIRRFPVVEIDLKAASGAVLREDIKADRDLPPFHKALMDGAAIKLSSYKSGLREFKIEGTQSAGIDALSIEKETGCTEIMTGAVLSKGADCVVPIEDLKIEDDLVFLQDGLKLKRMMHVHPKGSDHKKGAVLIKKGRRLQPQHIATAAAVGKARIKTSYKPKIAVISTGDELVEIDESPLPFQIRKSNSYFIKTALDKTRLFETTPFHFKDNKKVLIRQIGAILERFDVLVLTGGISMGKFDYIPEVMKELNVDILFQKVKQKPGKPFWYGRTKRNQPVFALPGNPISTQVGTVRHVIPNLKKALGLKKEPAEYVALTENINPRTPFTYFALVTVEVDKEGRLHATPVPSGGSGDFAATAKSDGFIEIPAQRKNCPTGFKAKLYRF